MINRKLNIILSVAGVAVAIALLLSLPHFWKVDYSYIVNNVQPLQVLVLVLLYACYLLLRTYRFNILLGKSGVHAPFVWTFKVLSISNLVGQFTIGNLGESIRIAMLKKEYSHSKVKDQMVLFVMEKTADVTVMAMLSLFALVALACFSISLENRGFILFSSVGMFAVGAALFLTYLRKHVNDLRKGLLVVVLSVLSNLFIFAMVYCSFLWVVHASFMHTFVMLYVSSIVGVLSMLPSGRGASELSMLAIATVLFGYDADGVSVAISQVLFGSWAASFLAPVVGMFLCLPVVSREKD